MLKNALSILEITYPFISLLNNSRSQSEVNKHVSYIKEKVKKQRKVLAKKYHPDVCEGGEENMKAVNSSVDLLLQLRIKYYPPKPIPIQVFVHRSSVWGGTAGTTASASTTYDYW